MRVEAVPRLVEQDERRIVHECESERQALALAHREPAGAPARDVLELEPGQRGLDLRAPLPCGNQRQPRPVAEMLRHREACVEPCRSRRQEPDLRLVAAAISPRREPVELHDTGVRGDDARDDPEQGRLAGAVPPDDERERGRWQLEVDALEQWRRDRRASASRLRRARGEVVWLSRPLACHGAPVRVLLVRGSA